MKTVFTTYGIPETVVSDNIPYNSLEFREFAHNWNFNPVYTTPQYSQSNGFAEKGVSIAKSKVSKSEEWQYGLLQYRNTPLPALGFSPAQLLYGRILRTKLPMATTQLQQQFINLSEVLQKKKTCRKEEEVYVTVLHMLFHPLQKVMKFWFSKFRKAQGKKEK